MKCTFSAREPNILMEAEPGDLFVPLGPDLVECVCAARSYAALPGGAPQVTDGSAPGSLDPNLKRAVIVIACRVGKGEPEYYPTGFEALLSGATPIAFLEQVEPAAFRERGAQIHTRVVNVMEPVALTECMSDRPKPRFFDATPAEDPAPEEVANTSSYPDDFEVKPIRRTSAPVPPPTQRYSIKCPINFGAPKFHDGGVVRSIAATEANGAPISRL